MPSMELIWLTKSSRSASWLELQKPDSTRRAAIVLGRGSKATYGRGSARATQATPRRATGLIIIGNSEEKLSTNTYGWSLTVY